MTDNIVNPTLSFDFNKSTAIQYLEAFSKVIVNDSYSTYRTNLKQSAEQAYRVKLGKIAAKVRRTAHLSKLDTLYNVIVNPLNSNVADYLQEVITTHLSDPDQALSTSKKKELESFAFATQSASVFSNDDLTRLEHAFGNKGIVPTPLALPLGLGERRFACIFNYLRGYGISEYSLPEEYRDCYYLLDSQTRQVEPAKLKFVDWSKLLDAARTLHPYLDNSYSLSGGNIYVKFNYKKHKDLLDNVMENKDLPLVQRSSLIEADKDLLGLVATYNKLTGTQLSIEDLSVYKDNKRQYVMGLATTLVLLEILDNKLVSFI